jgi:hypothetical protein
LVYWRDSPVQWFTIDVRTRQTVEVLPRIDHDIHNVQYSPDGGWLSFDVPVERTVFVAALRDGSKIRLHGKAQILQFGHSQGSSAQAVRNR